MLKLVRKRFATVRVHEFKMTLNLQDHGLSRQVFIYRDRERVLGYILRSLLTEGMNVVDVGGNIGYYPLMESVLVGETGTVYVLEPLPSNFELLNRNVRLNKLQSRIHTHMLAAFDAIGQQRFYVSRASNLGTMFPSTPDTYTTLDLTGEHIVVRTVDLSTFLQPLEKIHLIRMDPEGAEVGIIRGLLPSIRSGLFDGRVITEIHPRRYDEGCNNFRSVLREMFALGYYPELVTSDSESAPCFRDRGYSPEECLRESNTLTRGIYRNFREEDVLDLVTTVGAMRDLILAKRKKVKNGKVPEKSPAGENP